jgi:hypothetical protein
MISAERSKALNITQGRTSCTIASGTLSEQNSSDLNGIELSSVVEVVQRICKKQRQWVKTTDVANNAVCAKAKAAKRPKMRPPQKP